MSMKTSRPSSLGLVVLGMLVAEPMHAYRMQKMIMETAKDKVVNVRRPASMYQTIDRLARLGLIRVLETVRTESHPDRVVYEITDQGRVTVKVWLHEMLTTIHGEFPNFTAAVSALALLTPSDAREQFEIRADAIKAELAELDSVRQKAGDLPRLFLLEDEYQSAVFEAELKWLEAVIKDLSSGKLSWDEPWLRKVAAKYLSKDSD
jgi:DNA-binding PadR family transcriptional regulator